MKRMLQHQIVATCFLSFSVGCATVQSLPGKLNFMASKEQDANDPLANVSADVSSDFKAAKKELKSADDTLIKYAQMREDMGNYDVALERYRELLADNSDNVGARLGIARIEYKNGRVHEAEQILKAAARRHPDNLQVWIDMGKIQSDRKEYGSAIQSLQKAVDLDSSSQVARFELGLAMARGDRLEEAKSHLGFAVGKSAALFNIGYVLNEAGRSQEAVHFFEQTLDSFPNEQTRNSATQMIATLGRGGSFPSDTQLASAKKIPSRVLLEESTFQQWKETPSSAGILSGNGVNGAVSSNRPQAPSQQVAQSQPVLLPPMPVTPQQFSQPRPAQAAATERWQPSIQQVGHQSQVPNWGSQQPQQQQMKVIPSSSSTAAPATKQEDSMGVAYPPQWKNVN